VGEQRIGQGRENARQGLKDNPALLQELEMKVRAGGLGVSAGAVPDGDPQEGED
jgi:recombination protein RecA